MRQAIYLLLNKFVRQHPTTLIVLVVLFMSSVLGVRFECGVISENAGQIIDTWLRSRIPAGLNQTEKYQRTTLDGSFKKYSEHLLGIPHLLVAKSTQNHNDYPYFGSLSSKNGAHLITTYYVRIGLISTGYHPNGITLLIRKTSGTCMQEPGVKNLLVAVPEPLNTPSNMPISKNKRSSQLDTRM